jgi:6-phosphogluconolactonase
MKTANVKLNVIIVTDSQALAQEMLSLFISDVQRAIEASGRFCAAISRHTPKVFFEMLGNEPLSKTLPWDKIHLFWVDECCGCPDLGNNNYDLAAYSFIPKAGIPAENVHRICSENRNCGYVASIYEQTIHNVVTAKKNGVPRFDLIMLRMGADGHVASLFPDTYAFFDTQDLVWVTYFMDNRYTRITLTNLVLCAASHIAVVVCGRERTAILREVLTSKPDKVRYPIHAIWPILDKVTWFIDRSAAEFLRPHYLLNKLVWRNSQSIRPYRRL